MSRSRTATGVHDRPQTGGRVDIIRSITTTLGLYVLIVLVAEAILGVIAAQQSGTYQFVIGIGMVILLLLALVAPVARPDAFMPRSVPSAKEVGEILPNLRYDAFISAPMAALPNDETRESYHKEVLKVIKALEDNTDLRTFYYAGSKIVNQANFQLGPIALVENITALRDSKYFIMIYDRPVVTSSLVEAGMALALRKPSVLFVKDKKELPYLLQGIGAASQNHAIGLPTVKIFEDIELNKIATVIRNNKQGLLH